MRNACVKPSANHRHHTAGHHHHRPSTGHHHHTVGHHSPASATTTRAGHPHPAASHPGTTHADRRWPTGHDFPSQTTTTSSSPLTSNHHTTPSHHNHTPTTTGHHPRDHRPQATAQAEALRTNPSGLLDREAATAGDHQDTAREGDRDTIFLFVLLLIVCSTLSNFFSSFSFVFVLPRAPRRRPICLISRDTRENFCTETSHGLDARVAREGRQRHTIHRDTTIFLFFSIKHTTTRTLNTRTTCHPPPTTHTTCHPPPTTHHPPPPPTTHTPATHHPPTRHPPPTPPATPTTRASRSTHTHTLQ